MVIRGRAPLRVSFGGGGTDVAPFCEEQGGAIIGSTINKYAYCSIVPREDDQIVVHSLDFDMTVKYNTRENYVYDGKLDLVTAALNAMGIDQGCEIFQVLPLQACINHIKMTDVITPFQHSSFFQIKVGARFEKK